MTKAQKLLMQAKEIAKSAITWADLSNELFDPYYGLVARTFTTRAQRRVFMRTKEYRQLWKLMEDAIKRTGLVEGATPRECVEVEVPVPHSLRAALEHEAREKGISLNQLVLTKLAVQLKDVVRVTSKAS